MKKLLVGGWWLVFVGCASINQTLTTEIRHPDGAVEIKSTCSKAIAVFDAKQTIDKLKVSNTKASHTIGLDGIDNEASATKVVAALQAIERILEKIK